MILFPYPSSYRAKTLHGLAKFGRERRSDLAAYPRGELASLAGCCDTYL